ncbi:KPN_02809 family neutral zinc metallopeptidase [Nocardioides coralli]|uniref:KPN_02809 family neutral zinc metallopeptidase n=1 Tax=Nocardioides coralli TaxID=2872154 RepID=UPI001CA3B47F|nr:neutral zinc metallopeptidase [Nocardioides coralli]QZY27607.1 neutral zinc metallopeptidase [Nocardioides coralli]
MRFNPRARLDTGRMRDTGGRGGSRGGGGGAVRIPVPTGAKAGGGAVGLLVILLLVVLTQCVGGSRGGLPLPDDRLDLSRVSGADSNRYANCRTGADANTDRDCARVAVENSLTDYWSEQLPASVEFRPEGVMQTFTGSVSTGCGQATSQVGPFYCPVDEGIYLDTTFFREVLERQLGGPGGDFVEYYVLAHEYGHHVQNLLGTMGRVRTQQGPTSDAVRLELQADCYAGMWTRSATTTEDARGEPLIVDLTQADIDQAIAAAKAVGDDRIQDRTTGRVNPAEWTHGSAEQRQRWFAVGFQEGSLEACDTFSAAQL